MAWREVHKTLGIYERRTHVRVSDAPMLFDTRPWKQAETTKTDYLYREDEEGLHIALFYGGFPGYDDFPELRPEPKDK
jgi:hypothetical protein